MGEDDRGNSQKFKSRTIGRTPIRPDRVRGIGGEGFAFIPNRFLREGFLASLTADRQRLYLLLVLAADRMGLSFYHYDSICSLLEMTIDAYLDARNGLIDQDLIAYDGTTFQVLSLSAAPTPRSVHPLERENPGAPAAGNEIRRAILESFRRRDDNDDGP